MMTEKTQRKTSQNRLSGGEERQMNVSTPSFDKNAYLEP